MKKGRRWWMIPIVCLALILIVAVAFWPTFKVYLAPKTVLTAALSDTYSALSQRMQHSPVILIGKTLDFHNGNTIDLTLDSNHDMLGAIRYDMEIQTIWNPRQIAARGSVTSQGKAMDLSLYLDGDFAAISSDGLLQGNYYGLTYDTFGQDIRVNPLISLVIGEATLAEMEHKMTTLQEMMSKPVVMPSIQESDLKDIFVGIQAFPADVDRETLVLNNTRQEFFVISFEATGGQIQAGLDYLDASLPLSFDADEEIDISFWMKDDWVHRIELDAEDWELLLAFGSEDLNIIYENGGRKQCVRVNTQQTTDTYREHVQIIGEESEEISYSWNLSNGDLLVDVVREGEKRSLSSRLNSTETGFLLECSDFEGLMHLLMETEDTGDSPCVLNVSKGAAIETPVYKNFSQWSLEDLLTLLTGIGGLIGINYA